MLTADQVTLDHPTVALTEPVWYEPRDESEPVALLNPWPMPPPIERLKALQGLMAEHERDPHILRPTESRLRWLGQAVPLLSFNATLHQNAMYAADILARPGLSNTMYEQMEARVLLLVREAITELEHGLTPPDPPTEYTLTNEQGLWWFLQHCTTATRWWFLSRAALLLVAVTAAAYFAGRNRFISQVIDLWRKSTTP